MAQFVFVSCSCYMFRVRVSLKDKFEHDARLYSEEALKDCNKLIRRYRDNLSRKCSSIVNSRDILTRLLSNSDTVMLTFRKVRKCKQCSEVVQNCRLNCPNRRQDTYDQELLIKSLFVDKSS